MEKIGLLPKIIMTIGNSPFATLNRLFLNRCTTKHQEVQRHQERSYDYCKKDYNGMRLSCDS